MRATTQYEIQNAEDKLLQAMLDSNVADLNKMLSATLIFTDHLGHRLGKEDDLEAHRSGLLRIKSIRQSEQSISILDCAAVVSVRTQISGTYDGYPMNGDFRFTRVWTIASDGTWQVAIAHSTLIA